MPGESQRHILAVWNPTIPLAGMDSHVGLLRAAAERKARGESTDDDVFVWWGKVHSRNRRQPLPHLQDILDIDQELKGSDGPDREVQLWLTDYRSLYVGHVAEITPDDVREEDEDDVKSYVPPFYLRNDIACDCWFRLMDIRRVVVDDTVAVVEELKKLRNTRYHDQPVSLYGGMVELPLIVTREDDARYFEERVRKVFTGGRLWVEYDAEHSGIGAMERELRENLFGNSAWTALDPAARTFVATAEKVFRDHRGDAAFDFTPVIVGLAKAFEVQVNAVLRRALAKAPREARRAKVERRTVDVVDDGPLTIGELARAIGGEAELNHALKRRLRNGEWFTASLPAVLGELAAIRNPAAHTARVDREGATELRDRLVGVGYQGELVRLAGVRVI